MPGFNFIPKNDHAQALRIRRSLLAFYGYVLITTLVILSYAGGFIILITPAGIAAILFLLLAANLFVFTLFFTGVNKRFKDPSITVFQLMIGIAFCTLLAFFTASPLRGMVILLYILVLMFGVFRLKLLDFFALSLVATLLYAAAVTMLHMTHPEHTDMSLETIRIISLLLSLMWVSYLSTYIANLRRKIKLIASHDELTGIYNRREIFNILEREKALAIRSGSPFALCIIDIDDFKPVNDTLGHLAGDEVLKIFAQTLKENIRSEDYIGRYGGEEFIVILVNYKPEENACSYGCRLLQAVREMRFNGISEDLSLTASMGMAVYKPDESVDSLLARADAALYRAKIKGKDRVELEDGPQA
ncbi:MAG: GGDEF domain-containing protein [Desulfobacterales bacterium]